MLTSTGSSFEMPGGRRWRLSCRLVVLASIALAVVGAGAHATAAANSTTAAGISLSTVLTPLDGERVRVDLRNDGKVALQVQTRDTPFDTVHAHPLLIVERSLKAWSPLSRLSYIGPVAKREPPQPHEVLQLEPGETASALIDVGTDYRVDVTEPYRVTLAHPWRVQVVGESSKSGLDATSAAAATGNLQQISSRARAVMVLAAAETLQVRARAPNFDGCSAVEQADITAAADVAEFIVNDSVAALASASGAERSTSPRYTTWFGSFAQSRYTRVQENFAAISRTLADQEVNYVCGCSDAGVYAYVFPSRAYDIYLCPAFWNADIDGTDSRAGTIVHELSHFTVVAGTGDHRYSQSGSQQLAVSNPELAIDNADSHEYFAENTPFLEMAGTGIGDAQEGADTVRGLAAGELIEDTVALQETLSFRVRGSTRVRLDSLSGDADLTVWADQSRTVEICRSIATPPVSDHCELSGNEVWIDVYGYTAAHFRLVASVEGSATGTSIPLADAVVDGDTVDGQLEQGEFVAFAVNPGSSVSVESFSGDADLYLFDGFEATTDRLVCMSALAVSPESSVESCTATGTNVHLAVVFGFRTVDFELRVNGGASTEPVLPDEPSVASDIGDVEGDVESGVEGDVELASDDDLIASAGGGGGCSIGAAASSGAGGAMPVLALFLALLGCRHWRRRGQRPGRRVLASRGIRASVPASVLCSLLALATACTSSIGHTGGGNTAADEAGGHVVLDIGLERVSPAADVPSVSRVIAWVQNTGNTSVSYLLWNTPFEQPLSADVFDVVHDGGKRPYLGRTVKRAEPSAQDHVRLDPGARLEVQIDLAMVYDMSDEGRYTVSLAPTLEGEVFRFNESLPVRVVTEPLVLTR